MVSALRLARLGHGAVAIAGIFRASRLLATPGRHLSAEPADPRHVFTIRAHAFPALAAGGAGLVGGKLVGSALLMGRPATLAGDLALLLGVH